MDRGKLFVREHFSGHSIIAAEIIAANIELTRFPVPDDSDYQGTADYPGLVRAADLIGQLADPHAGVKGARAGIIMPGIVLLGARYLQEVAPGVALDRAEIVSINEVVQTPAGTFEQCVKTKETPPLEPDLKEFKFYAPGIGLVRDGVLKLVKRSKAEDAEDDD